MIPQRKRFFVAVEGESERAFVVWLQILLQNEFHIHLDSHLLGGGGFKSMLQKTVRYHEQGCRRGMYLGRFLIVDRDRAEQGDWPIEKLKQEAAKFKITVVVQIPNHEGLLFRMMPGMEHDIPNAAAAETRLKSHWPTYEKPANRQALERKFTLEDLLRVANADADLKGFLTKIGVMELDV